MLLVTLREGPRLKEKKWVFRSAEEAQKFQSYVHVLKERGQVLKRLFDAFDKRNKGSISTADLQKACKQVEIAVMDADVARMMAVITTNDSISYDDFFKMFMHSNCQNQHECIMEWLTKVAQQTTEEQIVAKKGARSSWLVRVC
jgi:Ca2+-binding EF-hand superfamily protein